jgi:hypothetical protein
MVPALYAIGVDLTDVRQRSKDRVKRLFRRDSGKQSTTPVDEAG